MSVYATADEERIRAGAQVRAWTQSGLLDDGARRLDRIRTPDATSNARTARCESPSSSSAPSSCWRLWDSGSSAFNLRLRFGGGLDSDGRGRRLFRRSRSSSSLSFGSIVSASKKPSRCGRWCWWLRDRLPGVVRRHARRLASAGRFPDRGDSERGRLSCGSATSMPRSPQSAAAPSRLFFSACPRRRRGSCPRLMLLAGFASARTSFAGRTARISPATTTERFESIAWLGIYGVLNLRLSLDLSPRD